MIGLDTNVLARYYIDDDADAEVLRQRLAARRLIESGGPRWCKSVVLELEGVMRGYYGFAQAEVASVLRHLLEQAHVTVEDRGAVEQALSNCEAGIDFADALHHASYRSCEFGRCVADALRQRVATGPKRKSMHPDYLYLVPAEPRPWQSMCCERAKLHDVGHREVVLHFSRPSARHGPWGRPSWFIWLARRPHRRPMRWPE